MGRTICTVLSERGQGNGDADVSRPHVLKKADFAYAGFGVETKRARSCS